MLYRLNMKNTICYVIFSDCPTPYDQVSSDFGPPQIQTGVLPACFALGASGAEVPRSRAKRITIPKEMDRYMRPSLFIRPYLPSGKLT